MLLLKFVRAFALCFILASCDNKSDKIADAKPSPQAMPSAPGDKNVSGQVFIVTESAQNIPLALVTIRVFSESQMQDFILNKKKVSDEIQAKLKSRYDDMSKRAEAAKIPKYPAIEKMEQTSMELDVMAHRVPQDGSQTKLRKRILSYVTGLQHAYEEDCAAWPTSEFYFEGLPSALAETKSDINGQFVVRLKPNETYVFAAKAERRMGASIERYCWLIRVNVSLQHDTVIMLANHNTTMSVGKESVIHCNANALKHDLSETAFQDYEFELTTQ